MQIFCYRRISGNNHAEAENNIADRLGSPSVWDRTAQFYFDLEVKMKKVGILMGSDSDLPIVEKAINTLAEYGVPYEVHVYSAHRTPVEAKEFSANARKNGFGAIIAAAGMAAHLAGAVAENSFASTGVL